MRGKDTTTTKRIEKNGRAVNAEVQLEGDAAMLVSKTAKRSGETHVDIVIHALSLGIEGDVLELFGIPRAGRKDWARPVSGGAASSMTIAISAKTMALEQRLLALSTRESGENATDWQPGEWLENVIGEGLQDLERERLGSRLYTGTDSDVHLKSATEARAAAEREAARKGTSPRLFVCPDPD